MKIIEVTKNSNPYDPSIDKYGFEETLPNAKIKKSKDKPDDNAVFDDPKGTLVRDSKMSKAAKMVKEIVFKSRGLLPEDMYDGDKLDKDTTRSLKKPSLKIDSGKKDITGQEKNQARAVLSGGKTLTGTERDDIEFDPMMRNRPGQTDPTDKERKENKNKKNDK